MSPAPPTYWHGGVPGLQVGQLLLPGALTGQQRAISRQMFRLGVLRAPPLDERVYLFADRLWAEVWAALYHPVACGWVYEVLPEGALEQDPEPAFRPGESWHCARARVLATHRLKPTDLVRVHDAMAARLHGGVS